MASIAIMITRNIEIIQIPNKKQQKITVFYLYHLNCLDRTWQQLVMESIGF